MESHLDSNQIADLTANLNIPRLRSRTESLYAATQRLLEEVDRSMVELGGPQAHAIRLRVDQATTVKASDSSESPVLGRSGVPQALTAIFEGAERLQLEVERVSAGVEKHADLIRGTDLGDLARQSIAVGGAFVRQLLSVTASHDLQVTYDSARLSSLADGLRNAIDVLGNEYPSESSSFTARPGIMPKA